MGKTDGPVVCYPCGVSFLGNEDNKCLIKEGEPLLVHIVELLNCLYDIIFHNFPTSGEEKPNVAIRPRGLFFGGSHNHSSYVLF
jgi:hypothetical protein